MNISVILCSFNRCECLAKALASVACLNLPEHVGWEVLVVDNNSTDGTREVVQDYCRRYPSHFRYLLEHHPGKSHALNAGIREARGEVIAFIDDDVIVEPAWLHNLTSSLQSGHWAGAGGRILPQGSFAAPPWIPLQDRYALAPLAVFNPGLTAGSLGEPPFGANMAYKRRVFEQYGGFRTDLGPGAGAGRPQKSEDSEFGHRLLEAGEQLRYEPSATVYHAIPEFRLKMRYFLGWWFDKARADVRAFGVPSGTRWRVAGVPSYLVLKLARSTVQWLFTAEPRRRFGAKIRVWVGMGEILECHRMAVEARRRP